MQKRFGLVAKPLGRVVPFAAVLVKTDPGAVVATLYSDNNFTPLANPLTCDQYGQYAYYATDGLYSETVSSPSIDTNTTYGILLNSGAGPGSLSLSGLTDVTLTTPATSDVLTYNGANWVNEPPSGGGAVVTQFTPKIFGVGTNGVGTYDYQLGWYSAQEKLVTFSIAIGCSDHTGTGRLALRKNDDSQLLPYPAQELAAWVYCYNFPSGVLNGTYRLIGSSSAGFKLYWGGPTSIPTAADVPNATSFSINVSGSYIIP